GRARARHRREGALQGAAPPASVGPRPPSRAYDCSPVTRQIVSASGTSEGALPEAPQMPAPPAPQSPLSGGPLALVGFLFRHRMLTPKYGLLAVRLSWRRFLTPAGYRMKLGGMLFLGRRVTIQIGRTARLRTGRWVWIGHGTKIRCHEGEVEIGD